MTIYHVLAPILQLRVVGRCRSHFCDTFFKLTMVEYPRFALEIAMLSVIVPTSSDISI